MYVSTTSLVRNGYSTSNPLRYTNSETVPYYVLPSSLQTQGSIKIGDVAYIYNTSNGLGRFAIFADVGPSGKLGEGSIYLANKIGINSNARTGGTSSSVIEYIVFPNSGFGQGKIPTIAQIDSVGIIRLKAIGGYSITNCLNSNPATQITGSTTVSTPTTVTTNTVVTNINLCAGSLQLTSSTSCNFTNSTLQGATQSFTFKPSCDLFSGTPAKKDVFFSFIATSTSHSIQIKPTSANSNGVDAIVSLLTGTSCTSLIEVNCLGTGNNGVAKTLNASGLTIGKTYWIRVYDYGVLDPIDPRFSICITHSNATNTTSASAQKLITGISEDQELLNSISPFPNPNNGVFSVNFPEIGTKQVDYTLLNTLGQQIKKGAITSTQETFDISEHTNGIYFLVVNYNGLTHTYKLLKQ